MPAHTPYKEIKRKLELLASDVNACKQKLTTLDDDQKIFQDLIQNAPFGYIVCDEKGNIIACNTSAKALLKEVIGKKGKKANLFKLETLKGIDLFTILSKCLNDLPVSHQSSLLTDDDRVIYLQWHFIPIKDKSGKLTGIQAILDDISERKKIETRMLHAHRLESIGALATGIAHDFNNIIWIINGNLELAFGELPPGSPVRYHLEQAEHACQRAKDLISQISNYSRISSNDRQKFDLCPIVKESLKFLRASMAANINIRQHISDQPLHVLADITQINQLLMHLYANSVQSIKNANGAIEVNLIHMAIERQETIDTGQILPGNYILLSISDTGVGIPQELQKRIFDPFFTTKEGNENAGVGLFIVKAIVESHNGLIRINSRDGEGTTVNVFLPSADEDISQGAIFQHASLSEVPKGTERILLVDDEEQIVKVEKSMLTNLGYQITAQNSSIKALQTFQADPMRFDLLITDEDMPEMTGSELSRYILKLRPHIPIILISGHKNPSQTDKNGIKAHLSKPLPGSLLAKTVRSVLDKTKEEAPP